MSFFACRVIGHCQGSRRLFFVFCWATLKMREAFLFSVGVQGFKSLDFVSFLQFGALIPGFVLEFVD